MDKLIECLRAGVVNVSFTKIDGSKRIMNCTLSMDLIPTDQQPKGEDDKLPLDEVAVIPVFDVDLQEWRSFRKDNVIEWAVV